MCQLQLANAQGRKASESNSTGSGEVKGQTVFVSDAKCVLGYQGEDRGGGTNFIMDELAQ